MTCPPVQSEQDLLDKAIAGDQRAFDGLVSLHRRRIFGHCYRMLGSPHDADDALQETLLAAWRGLATFDGRGSFAAWLYRIGTNACLRMISKRPKRSWIVIIMTMMVVLLGVVVAGRKTTIFEMSFHGILPNNVPTLIFSSNVEHIIV